MKSKLFSISLAFVLLTLVLTLISTIASAGQEIRVTGYGERGFSPAVYHNKIIWLDGKFGGTIHMRDLLTGKEIQVINKSVSRFTLCGDRIVWESEGNISTYNISTTIETQVTLPYNLRNRGWKDFLGVYNNKIVWQISHENGTLADIYAYDPDTQDATQITKTESDIDKFAIYDDRIVWRDQRNDNGTGLNTDIYLYNLSTSTETQITTNGSAWSPKIYGDRIVYKDWRNNNIYLYNISTSTETLITKSESDHPVSAIYGNRIVWQDSRNGNYDVYIYDLSSHKEIQITSNRSDQLNPAIYSDRIVWEDYRNPEESDYASGIYMYDFSDDPIIPFASFSTNLTSGSGNVPLTVLFNDTSSGGKPASWYWDFGDGINSKHAQTATHTFMKPGTYNVSLTVANAAGSSTVNKVNCITVTSPQAPVADFFSPRVVSNYGESVPVNETLLFMDNSTGSPSSWYWDFGDGATSTTQNPTHKYVRSGGYIITLTVRNEMGNDTVTKHGYVIVDSGGNPVHPANFSSNVTSGSAPLTVLFYDTTVPDITGDYAYGRDWYFGDGTSSYNTDVVREDNNILDESNSAYFYIIHTYKNPGKYTVELNSYDIVDSSVITKYNYITVTDPAVQTVNFSANVTSGTVPLVVLFTDTGTGEAPASWLWDFGDGTSSKHAMNATHTFAYPGLYNVTLTVTNKTGSSTVTKPDYVAAMS